MSREKEQATCWHCQFWDARRSDDETGYCRRYAPRPTYELTAIDPADRRVNRYIVFPETSLEDWCGELVEREGVEQA